jgi:hypothetical protein
MKASEFDAAFDAGEDISEHVDWSSGSRLNDGAKRVNVDFPLWMLSSIDRQAKRLGVTRKSLIKMWLAEKLQQAN